MLGAILAIAAIRSHKNKAEAAGLSIMEVCQALEEDTGVPYGLIINDATVVSMFEAGTTYEELLDYLDWAY